MKIAIATGLILIYLFWALQHHHRDKSLTWEIVLEYILTAALVAIILFSILL
ncbi:MAG: hypothetical protein HYW45_00780 [Candidatus Daviesbacteria bacterium]|nr:MAG: hypothetical protein HYW45_00780 [Candidatus Daviesbacteria bacterium]